MSREHVWPKSWYGYLGRINLISTSRDNVAPGSSGKGTQLFSDLFELFPTDGFVNNKRGNYPMVSLED